MKTPKAVYATTYTDTIGIYFSEKVAFGGVKSEDLPRKNNKPRGPVLLWEIVFGYPKINKKERGKGMKKTKSILRLLSLLLLLFVVVAASFALVACEAKETDTEADTSSDVAVTGSEEIKGTITITVSVVNSAGETSEFVIETEAENLRGALEQENLIEGDESEFGLYVKYVNGERADYDLDGGAYWSFTKDGELLFTGVDNTPISDGDHFEITYTK